MKLTKSLLGGVDRLRRKLLGAPAKPAQKPKAAKPAQKPKTAKPAPASPPSPAIDPATAEGARDESLPRAQPRKKAPESHPWYRHRKRW